MGEEKEVRKYNGWANYETWAVRLWLDNEEPSYRYWTEAARAWRGREGAACGLARQLKDELSEGNPLEEASLYSDLLWAALGEVDWHELAESYLDEVEPDSTDEERTCDGQAMPEPTPGGRPEDLKSSEPERLDAESFFGGVIFAYTRKQALADGVLVDVTETARFADFRFPVALTRAVWDRYVSVPEGVEAQDEDGRLWDIVWMCRVAVGRKQDTPELLFQLHVRNDNRDGMPPLVTLKAVCGPDDDGSPCITIMLPDED